MADALSLTQIHRVLRPESCAFVTEGDDEEKWMTERGRGEVRRFGWGPDPRLSSARRG